MSCSANVRIKGGCCGAPWKSPCIKSNNAPVWNGLGTKCAAPRVRALSAACWDTTLERMMILGELPRCRSSFSTVKPQISGSTVSINRRSGAYFCVHMRTSLPLPTVIIEKCPCCSVHFHMSQRNSSLPSAKSTILRRFMLLDPFS